MDHCSASSIDQFMAKQLQHSNMASFLSVLQIWLICISFLKWVGIILKLTHFFSISDFDSLREYQESVIAGSILNF